MNIEEIRKNAPEMANYYKMKGSKVVYFSVRTRHLYRWVIKNKWSNDWNWDRLIDYNDTDSLKPLF